MNIELSKLELSKLDRKTIIPVLAIGLLLLIVVALWSGGVIFKDKSNIVRVLVLEGIITESDTALTGITPRLVSKYLRQSEDYGAIVLRINSPGGSVVASQEILDIIRRFRRDNNIPIVASIGETGASGAYYIILRADKIVANPGSITGSIGVISQFIYVEGLLNKLGIETEIVKSGEYKDLGSKPMTEEQKAIIQDVSDDIYRQFITEVAKSRGMDIGEVKQLATGEVFTGNRAFQLGLIDMVGNLNDAVVLARELKDLEGEEVEIEYPGDSIGIFDMLNDIRIHIIKSMEGGYSLRWQLVP